MCCPLGSVYLFHLFTQENKESLFRHKKNNKKLFLSSSKTTQWPLKDNICVFSLLSHENKVFKISSQNYIVHL